MSVNFNDTTPAATSPSRNVKWQQDGSGNTSANYSLIPTKTTVAPVAGVLTIDASLGDSFLVNVNAAITSTVISNPTDGQEITIVWKQDGTGHAVVLATNMKGAYAPSSVANAITTQKFTYDTTLTNWYFIDTYLSAVAVAPAAGVLTLDMSLGTRFRVNVNAAITSMSITNPQYDGQPLEILWVQDAIGHAITLATNLKGATAPTVTANSVSSQRFAYDLTLTNWYAIAAGVTGM